MLRLLPAVLMLCLTLACGPAPMPATSITSRALITNNYAVSLFSLSVLSHHSTVPVVLFTNERIESGATATSPTFATDIGGTWYDFTLDGTSLGEKHTFTGTAKLYGGAERLALVYDYDLALAQFSTKFGTQADP